MGGRGGGSSIASKAAAPSAALSGDESAERTIHELYDQLNVTHLSKGGHPFKADIVSLSRLRDGLRDLGWSREKQDAQLMRLMRAGKVVMVPESNQKTLTQKQRDDAIHFGGQDKHLIGWDRG